MAIKKTNIMLTSFVLVMILVVGTSMAVPIKHIIHHQYSPPSSPQAPSLSSSLSSSIAYTVNEDKSGEGDAFRPTAPGHSPGVGHESPPTYHRHP
ncbi:uncharacterized protein DS421_1g09690 [Arachis hypogaea]|nr:uncharacterized protein DS421_1g09690 [Arachis hypogaea]